MLNNPNHIKRYLYISKKETKGEKMKIVHLVYSGVAGSPRGTLLLAQREKSIAKPHIMFFGGKKVNEEYLLWVKNEKISYSHIKKQNFYDFSFLYSLPIKLMKEKPDILFVHGTNKFLFVSWYKIIRPKTKIIVVEHGPGLHLDRRMTDISARLTNRIADGLVFVSDDVKQYWWNKYKRFPKRNIVISNGVDIEEFSGIERKILYPGFKTITMVAVMSAQKDNITLVRAAAELKKRGEKVKTVFVGDGPCRKSIEDEIDRLGLKDDVIIKIFPPRKEVLEIIKSTDIYVLSTNGEGLSRSILEAMAAKVPIITTDVSGNTGFIENGKNGILVPLKDHVKMADEISALLKNPKKREELATYAFSKLKKENSIEVAVGKFIKFIQEVTT
jgi:glycosyltransferase involved in cell wall biosynthesis